MCPKLLLAFVAALSLVACDRGQKTSVIDRVSPYLSLKIREQDRVGLLDVADQLLKGQFDAGSAALKRVEIPELVRIGVNSEGYGKEGAEDAVREAIENWNQALKGAVSFETGTPVESADLAIYFQETVMEVQPSLTMPGASDISVTSDNRNVGARRATLRIAYLKPDTRAKQSQRALAHLVAKGIGSYLGLTKTQLANEFMGSDSLADTLPVNPGEADVTRVLQRLRFERALADAVAARTKPAIRFPIIQFDSTQKSTGPIWRGDQATVGYSFTNTGQAPLELEARPTCGCAVVKFDKLVQSGASGKVEVTFDSHGYSGRVVKHVEVYANAPSTSNLQLQLTADVKPNFVTEPRADLVASLDEKGPTNYEFVILPVGHDGAVVTKVECDAEYLKAQVTPEKGAFRVKMTIGPEAPAGRTVQTLKVTTTSKREPEFNSTIAFEKGICVIPTGAYFGFLRGTEPLPLERTIQVVRHTKPFTIKKVDTGDPKLEAKFDAGKPGEYLIHLKYLGGWKPGTNNRVLIIETDDPKQPKIEVPVQASVSTSAQ